MKMVSAVIKRKKGTRHRLRAKVFIRDGTILRAFIYFGMSPYCVLLMLSYSSSLQLIHRNCASFLWDVVIAFPFDVVVSVLPATVSYDSFNFPFFLTVNKVRQWLWAVVP